MTVYRAYQPTPLVDPGHGYTLVLYAQDFPVLPEDQVFVQTKEGLKAQGYNHSRAWSAALKYATTRPDYRSKPS